MKTTVSMFRVACIALCCTLGIAVTGNSATPEKVVDPAAFDTDRDGALDADELFHYVVSRDKLKPNLDAVLTKDMRLRPDAESLVLDDLRKQSASSVGEIRGRLQIFGGGAIPVDKLRGLQKADAAEEVDGGFSMPGVIAKSKKGACGEMGPFLLRKSADDWSKDPKSAQGANLTYSDNGKDGKTAWASEGALIYPFRLSGDNTGDDPEADIRSWRLSALPSMSWKVNKIGGTDDGDIEELLFQTPLLWSANHVGLGWLRNSAVKLAPYLHTDFGFEGLILGSSLSYAPYIFDDVSGFALNTGYKGLGKSPFMYRLGLAPTVDFNHLCSESEYIERKDHDDYLRAGGKAEAGLITSGYPALEIVTSYQAFEGLIGAPSQSDLLSLSGKLWFNANLGLSAEYQRGETPVAQKDVDLVTLGLELKY